MVHQNCNQMSHNQACYGHDLLVADARPGANPFTFVTEGDIEDLAKLHSLRLSGLDENAGTWGVAVMQLRASLPASRPEHVTLLAFGDVQIQNAVLPVTQTDIQIETRQYVNVRQLPSINARVVGALAPGQTATVVERLNDSTWLRVLLPEIEQTGWVMANLVSSTGDLNSLNVSAGNTSYFQEPMQAFYFSSGATDSTSFSQLPEDGLIIQTPQGVGEVQFLINEINIQLGSTVFFQAQPGNHMIISTLEGHADVQALGIGQTVLAGTQVVIPLNADLRPSGPPSMPRPYDKAEMDNLPTRALPQSITIAEPMTFTEILERQAELYPRNTTDSANTPGSDNDDDDDGGSRSSRRAGSSSPSGGNNDDDDDDDDGGDDDD
jgi:hypothetical protein